MPPKKGTYVVPRISAKDIADSKVPLRHFSTVEEFKEHAARIQPMSKERPQLVKDTFGNESLDLVLHDGPDGGRARNPNRKPSFTIKAFSSQGLRYIEKKQGGGDSSSGGGGGGGGSSSSSSAAAGAGGGAAGAAKQPTLPISLMFSEEARCLAEAVDDQIAQLSLDYKDVLWSQLEP